MKHPLLSLFFVLFALTSFYACNGAEEKELREQATADLTDERVQRKRLDGYTAEQYRAMELVMNEQYAKRLKKVPQEALEKQLERFEDEELGVWGNLSLAWDWLFADKREWNDRLTVMSNTYFNSLDTDQAIYAHNERYIKEIKALRSQFQHGAKRLPQLKRVEVEQQYVSMTHLSEHTGGNLAIEIGTEILEWFLGFIIINVICLVLDVTPLTVVAWILHIVVFIITLIVSIWLSSKNDAALLDSLRAQSQQHYDLKAEEIKEKLDQNTYQFYAAYE